MTPNNAPDDNMNIKDKSQEPQTCAGPQGREEGNFQGWAAPGCSHMTLPAPTPPQFCMLALLFPALCLGNSYLHFKVHPRVTSSGIVLTLTVPGSPFTALTTVSSSSFACVCLGHDPSRQKTSWAHPAPAHLPTPHSLSLGIQEPVGERGQQTSSSG